MLASEGCPPPLQPRAKHLPLMPPLVLSNNPETLFHLPPSLYHSKIAPQILGRGKKSGGSFFRFPFPSFFRSESYDCPQHIPGLFFGSPAPLSDGAGGNGLPAALSAARPDGNTSGLFSRWKKAAGNGQLLHPSTLPRPSAASQEKQLQSKNENSQQA